MTADHLCKKPRSCVSTSVFAALLACLSAMPIRADAAEPLRFSALPKDQQVLLDDVERRTFDFFRDSQNTANGLVPDGWPQQAGSDFFSSIASIGFGLTAYGIGAERGWMKRSEAAKRTLTILRFFRDSAQGESGDVTGAHGFYYHFLDMQSGRRFEDVELSSIDSTMLFYGMLFAQSYYDRNDEDEKEIRRIADELYRRADWQWFAPRAPLVSMGWTPKDGFIRDDWHGFTEAAMLYVLALGSPTHALDPDGWKQWAETYPHNWEVVQGQEHLAGGPMFWHQYSQTWIDFRGIQDDYMRKRGIDYFVNSQRAALAQRQYAIHNPLRWKDYGATIWG
ncbi:MAG: glucoamylase family protein, partial [Rudaea sp.]